MPPKKKHVPVVQAIPCADKDFDDAPPQDHPLSMPRGKVIAIVGPCNVGKSSLLKNQLVRSSPWAAVYVIHGAAEHSKEYDLVRHTKTTFAEASPEYWAEQHRIHRGKPIALVVDDTNFSDLNKAEKSNAYALAQFCCSHFNITAWLVAHSWTQLVPRLRRMAAVVFLYPNSVGGQDAISYQARSLGLPAKTLANAMAQCTGKYEFVTIYSGADIPEGRSAVMVRDASIPFDTEGESED
jgi:hypothetical protein